MSVSIKLIWLQLKHLKSVSLYIFDAKNQLELQKPKLFYSASLIKKKKIVHLKSSLSSSFWQTILLHHSVDFPSAT